MRKDKKHKVKSNYQKNERSNKPGQKQTVRRKGRQRTKKAGIKAAKRTIKDCVFTDLFRMPENLLALYRTLHPEDMETTAEDLKDITISNVLVDDIYNDLGFQVRGHLIILVEAQSTWSVNIIVRSLLYLADSYQQYIIENNLDVYGSKKIPLPRPELYVIYTGERKDHPEEISLKETFFPNEESAIDVKVKVLYGTGKHDIISQYVAFTKIFDEQRRIHGRTLKAVTETIRICKNKNILKKYLESREKEVITMMSILYDDEFISRSYEARLKKEITEQVTEQGIGILVRNFQRLGESFNDTVKEVQTSYELTEGNAKKLVEKFWQPEPVQKH